MKVKLSEKEIKAVGKNRYVNSIIKKMVLYLGLMIFYLIGCFICDAIFDNIVFNWILTIIFAIFSTSVTIKFIYNIDREGKKFLKEVKFQNKLDNIGNIH